jgi:hypothetical protein
MNCPSCASQMVKARATAFGDEYSYCRVCKKELKEIRMALNPDSRPGTVPMAEKYWKVTEIPMTSIPVCYIETGKIEYHQAAIGAGVCSCGMISDAGVFGWRRNPPRERK